MDKLKKFSVYIWTVLLISIDQIAKIIVVNKAKNDSIIVIKNILKFTYCENKGVAFSLGDGHVPIFVGLNILIIFLLLFFYEKNYKDFSRISKIFFSMIIAGGASNLIDRIIRGFVVDFIDVTQLIQFAIFNIADIFIVMGIFGMAITFIIKERNKVDEYNNS